MVGGSSYSSTSVVLIIRKTLPSRFISFTPVLESSAGIPRRSEWSGGLFGDPLLTLVPVFSYLLVLAYAWRCDRSSLPHGLNVILIIGCNAKQLASCSSNS